MTTQRDNGRGDLLGAVVIGAVFGVFVYFIVFDVLIATIAAAVLSAVGWLAMRFPPKGGSDLH